MECLGFFYQTLIIIGTKGRVGFSRIWVTSGVVNVLLERGKGGASLKRGVGVETGRLTAFLLFQCKKVVKKLITSNSEKTDYFNLV